MRCNLYLATFPLQIHVQEERLGLLGHAVQEVQRLGHDQVLRPRAAVRKTRRLVATVPVHTRTRPGVATALLATIDFKIIILTMIIISQLQSVSTTCKV